MIERKLKLSTILDFLVNNIRLGPLLADDCCILCKQSKTDPMDYLCNACVKDLPYIHNSCSQCGLPLNLHPKKQFNLVCGECISEPPVFTKTIAPFVYSFPVKQGIHLGKYNNKKYWLTYYSKHITNSIPKSYKEDELPDLLLCVPMHKSKQKLRTYNQASLIARTIARDFNLRYEDKWLIKTKATTSSSLQNKSERRKTLENAFQLSQNAQIKDLHIAIVDDVMTTKMTSNTISKVLMKNGAKRIDVWCIARTTKR